MFITSSILTELESMNCDIAIDSGSSCDLYRAQISTAWMLIAVFSHLHFTCCPLYVVFIISYLLYYNSFIDLPVSKDIVHLNAEK